MTDSLGMFRFKEVQQTGWEPRFKSYSSKQ